MIMRQIYFKLLKGVIVLLLIISALLTPPDIFSQLMITVPAYLIFEISLLCILKKYL